MALLYHIHYKPSLWPRYGLLEPIKPLDKPKLKNATIGGGSVSVRPRLRLECEAEVEAEAEVEREARGKKKATF